MQEDYPKYEDVQDTSCFQRLRLYTKKYREEKDFYGVLDGEFKELDATTKTLLHRSHFVDGKLHGKYEGWYPNGQKWYEATYVDDQRQGLFQQWRQDGTKYDDEYFLDNNITVNNTTTTE